MAKIVDVIKYEGANDIFIWKHPREDFNTLTQLIVHESQEAIFMRDGEALDLFGPGRHDLKTQNIPLLSKTIEKTMTGGENPFHCEVYFVNKTVQMGIKWGTDSFVRFVDPIYGVPLEIGASGEMNIRVNNSRKLLVKLVGTMKNLAWDVQGGGFAQSLKESFRPLISTVVKSNIANVINSEKIDVLEIDGKLERLSQILRGCVSDGFEEYGLEVPQFFVRNIVFSEDGFEIQKIKELRSTSFYVKAEQARRQVEIESQITQTEEYRRHIERELLKANAEAHKKRVEGLAEAEVMQAKGYTKKDEMDRDVQLAYAESLGKVGSNVGGSQGGTGGSGVVGEFVNLGVGMATAGVIGNQVSEMLKGMSPTKGEESDKKALVCSQCGSDNFQDACFCHKCGANLNTRTSETICPSCGEKTPQGKYCIKCGKPLVCVCANCGKELPSGSNFCLNCGQKI